MKKTLSNLLILITLLSCNTKTETYKSLEDVSTQVITFTDLNTDLELGRVSQMWRYDTLLIVQDEMQEEQIQFLQSKTGKLLGHIGKIGQGVNEWVMPNNISLNPNTGILSVYEYAKNSILNYDLKEFQAGKKLSPQTVSLPEYPTRPKFVFPAQGDTWFALHGKPFLSLAKGKELVTTRDEYPLLPEVEDWEAKKRMYFMMSSLMATSPKGDKAVLATNMGAIMQFFEIENSSIQPTTLRLIIKPTFDFQKGMVGFSPETIFGFAQLQATDKYLYATLYGEKNPSMFPKKLLVFDWTGNLANTYSCEQQICAFTVDEKEQNLYIVTKGDDGEQKIMVGKLNL